MMLPSRPTLAATFALATFVSIPLAPAQTPPSTITWAQSYGLPYYDADGQPTKDNYANVGVDVPTNPAPMPDGGIVVAGSVGLPELIHGNAFSQGGAVVVRYAKDGSILWQHLLRNGDELNGTVYNNNNTFVPRKTLTDTAGNVFVLLALLQYGQPASLYVAKLSPAGELLWQNAATVVRYVIGTDGDGHPIMQDGAVTGVSGSGDGYGASNDAMAVTSDGGVILATGVYHQGTGYGGNGHTIPFIYKFNADGSVAFHRGYVSPAQYSGVTAIATRANGAGYALLLPSNSDNSGGGHEVVVLTDATGNPVTQRSFYGDSQYGGNPTDLVASPDGGFLLASLGGYGVVNVHKLAADLTETWQTRVRGGNASLNNFGTLSATPDNGCLLPAQDSYDHGQAILTVLDGQGRFVASHHYAGNVGYNNGPQTPWTPTAACVTTDGTAAFAVNTFQYGVYPTNDVNWWVVKTDALGKVIGLAATALDYTNTDVLAEPITTNTGVPSSDYGDGPNNEAQGANFFTVTQPAVVIEDLGAKAEGDHNRPVALFQANPAVSYNHQIFFGGEVYLGSGTYYLQFADSGNAFGYYGYLSDPDYIFHDDLGYEYIFDANDGKAGVYLYDFKSNGFFYTSPSFPFPYLYDFSLKTTLYYYPDPNNPGRYNTNGTRYFYNFATGKIISK